MSNVCCKEFTGWVKSFTKLERALTVLEAILLVILLVLLILLILHFIACSKPDKWYDTIQNTTSSTKDSSKGVKDQGGSPVSPFTEFDQPGFDNRSTSDSTAFANGSKTQPAPVIDSKGKKTTEGGAKCSWTPSAKTTAAVHYYEDGGTQYENKATRSNNSDTTTHVPVQTYHSAPTANAVIPSDFEIDLNATTTPFEVLEEMIRAEQSDGEDADSEYERHVLALVKLKPPKDIIFGCILTIVSDYWTLTAASCIEAIEETDSLDSFVIMENYGTDKKGPLMAVEDVQIHPFYEGKNKSYDLVALKSGTSLTKGTKSAVKLASYLDYALLTLAQKFIILGYGAFRSIDRLPSGRRLRQALVYRLPARQCGGGAAALRHLTAGRAAARAPCATAPALCAGVLFSRGLPCNYCAGAPLLVPDGALLGVLASSEHCGVSCEPALYVAVPDVADWIDATTRRDAIV